MDFVDEAQSLFFREVEGVVLTGSLFSLTPSSPYHSRQIRLGYFKWRRKHNQASRKS